MADLLDAGVDYLVCEALAELTLAILQKDRQRDESLGYTRDLPLYVGAALPFVLDGRTRFITNAGGINPVAAGPGRARPRSASTASPGVTVATVVGDDVRPHADELGLPDDALFANAYLGARPIVDALDAGAHIVITGRVADASLFLAPLVHELGWAWDDWDRLAAGVVVGHLLECSGQVTGGNYSGRWWENPDPLRIGFPIAEVERGRHRRSSPSRRHGRHGHLRHRARAAALRGARPGPLPQPRRHRRLHLAPARRPRRRPGAGRAAPAAARRPRPTRASCARPRAGRARPGSPTRGPTPRPRPGPRCAFVRGRAEANGVPVEEWHEEYFGVNAFGGPDGRARDRPTAEPARGDRPAGVAHAPTPESAARVGAEVGVLGLSGPPTIAGTGRGRGGRPTQLLAVDPIPVDRDLVDAQVRVDIETV